MTRMLSWPIPVRNTYVAVAAFANFFLCSAAGGSPQRSDTGQYPKSRTLRRIS